MDQYKKSVAATFDAGYLHESDLRAKCLDDPILDLIPSLLDEQGHPYVPDHLAPGFDESLHFPTYQKECRDKLIEHILTPLTALVGDRSTGPAPVIIQPRFADHERKIILEPDYLVYSAAVDEVLGDHGIVALPPELIEEPRYLVVNIVNKDIEGDMGRFRYVKAHLQQSFVDRIGDVVNPTTILIFQGRESEAKIHSIARDIPDHATATIEWAVQARKLISIAHAFPYTTLFRTHHVYPNMKNREDFPWHTAKKSIAHAIGELTCIWNCTYKAAVRWRESHESRGESLGGYRRNDFSAGSIGVSGKRSDIINALLFVNGDARPSPDGWDVFWDFPKDKRDPLLMPNFLEYTSLPKTEIFIDFEVLTHGAYPPNPIEAIFLIGVGHTINGENFQFRSFFLNDLDDETNLISDFVAHIENLRQDQKDTPIYHWTHAEKTFLKSACKRIHYPDCVREIAFGQWNWVDLEHEFRSRRVAVRGALNYRLKTLATAFKTQGLIETHWGNECADGMSAVTGYARYLDGDIPRDDPRLEAVIRYNEIDCKVMYEMLSAMRQLASKKNLPAE